MSVDVTKVLMRVRRGDPAAVAEVMPAVYGELRALAASFLRRERPNHTLQPTALVHEAYLKLVDQQQASWNDRAHFLAIAATVIRRLLIDHARKSGAAKRQRPRHVTIQAMDASARDELDVVALEEALCRLAERSPRQERVVELRFFGGLSVEEAAEVLGVSANTVKGDWRVARAWLQQQLEGGALA